MSSTAQKSEALEALRTFNTAITTIRLYPPSAPQVTNSVEKAYQAIKVYLRNHGILSFSHIDGPSLCGAPINQKTLGKVEGFEFFQQLELLKLNHLVLQPGFGKKTFQQLLSVFTTSHQQIAKEGGVQAFLASFDLSGFFPEEYTVVAAPVEQNQFADYLVEHTSGADKHRQYITHITGEGQDETLEAEIQEQLQNPESAALLIAVFIAEILMESEKGENVVAVPLFTMLLEALDHVLSTKTAGDTVLELSLSLSRNIKGNALAVVLGQDFPKGFGEALLNGLLARIDVDSFGHVIKQRRQQEKRLVSKYGKFSKQCKDIREKNSRLLSTAKGKQFLGQEKAKALLESGEWERRAKRVQAGLSSILQGNLEVLENEEIVQYLPISIERLIENSKDDVAAAIIEILAKEFVKEAEKGEDRLGLCMSAIGDNLIRLKKWAWLENLALPFVAWLKKVEKGDEACENILKLLHKIMLHAWKSGRDARADRILKVMHSIRKGILGKPPEVKKLVAEVLDQSYDRALLEKLLEQAFAESADQSSKARLSRQGVYAAKFLIEQLLESEIISERMRLLDILSDMGGVLPPILAERLLEPMAWHGKRNLIKLMAETGSEEYVEEVIRYVNHDDLRIQKETFMCLYKISGERRKEVLLEVLAMTSEQVMVQAVKALTSYNDDDVATELVGLLKNRDNFTLEVRSPLVIQVCQHLGHCSPEIAFEPLKEFQKTRGKGETRKLDGRVWDVVDDALSQLKSSQRATMASQQSLPSGATAQLSVTDFPEESEARYLFEKGRREKALEVLMRLIAKLARLKLFDQAEELREWLIKEEPSALGEIIKAAEIIEEEKHSAIDKGHMAIWSQLYDVLTPEEFNVFYYALEHQHYGTDEPIAEQGDTQSCLFFVNSGRIKLFYMSHGNEILVKTIGPGEVMGVNSFFDASVWTINASSINRVEVSILRFSKIPQWEVEYPALVPKLRDFCAQPESLQEFIQKTRQDRRKEKRLPVSGTFTAVFYGQEGEKVQLSVKGELADVSAGGVSFLLRISQKTRARLLLGRKVRLSLPSAGAGERICTAAGTVVAVKSLQSIDNDYSLHVAFDQALDPGKLQDVVRAGRKE